MRRQEFRMKRLDLLNLETGCFYLESRIRRLEYRWRRIPAIDPHQLRMERLRVRHEFEMLKIDIETFERRIQPLLDTEPGAPRS